MKLSDLKHLESVDAVRFKTETVNGNEYTIVSYMISDPSLWDMNLGLETRGHTFNSNGDAVSLPFEKFFNFRENKYTQPEVIGDLKVVNVFDKRDGSLITPVMDSERVITFKSKKSFYSDVATKVNSGDFANQRNLAEFMMQNGNITPIFEYTDREFQIVVDYGEKPELTLLAARYNDTGKYVPWENLTSLANVFDVPLIKRFDFPTTTLSELENILKYAENIEGFVVELENGMRVKLKAPWYLRLHHVNTDLRERDIAELFIDEELDDIKSSISLAGKSLDKIEDIERRVSIEVEAISHGVTELAGLISVEPTRKDAALKYAKLPLFGLAVKQLDGKVADINAFWKKTYLKDYSLKCVYNENFS